MFSQWNKISKFLKFSFFQLNLVYVIETLGSSFKKLHRIMVVLLQEHIVVMVFIGKRCFYYISLLSTLTRKRWQILFNLVIWSWLPFLKVWHRKHLVDTPWPWYCFGNWNLKKSYNVDHFKKRFRAQISVCTKLYLQGLRDTFCYVSTETTFQNFHE